MIGGGGNTLSFPSLQDCRVSPVAVGFGRRLAAAAQASRFLLAFSSRPRDSVRTELVAAGHTLTHTHTVTHTASAVSEGGFH